MRLPIVVGAVLLVVVAIAAVSLHLSHPPPSGSQASTGTPVVTSISTNVAGSGSGTVNLSNAVFRAWPSLNAPHNCSFALTPPSGVDALQVLVKDQNGAPLAGAWVSFAVEQGIQAFALQPAPPEPTDAQGLAHFTQLSGSILPNYPAGGILLVNATLPASPAGAGAAASGSASFVYGQVVVNAPSTMDC